MLTGNSQGLLWAVCQPLWTTSTIIILKHTSDPGLLCPNTLSGSPMPGGEPGPAHFPSLTPSPLASSVPPQLARCASLPAFLRRCLALGTQGCTDPTHFLTSRDSKAGLHSSGQSKCWSCLPVTQLSCPGTERRGQAQGLCSGCRTEHRAGTEGFALGGRETVLAPLDQKCGCCSRRRAVLAEAPHLHRALRRQSLHHGDRKVRSQESLRPQGRSPKCEFWPTFVNMPGCELHPLLHLSSSKSL